MLNVRRSTAPMLSERLIENTLGVGESPMVRQTYLTAASYSSDPRAAKLAGVTAA
jgi:hypothetical protein